MSRFIQLHLLTFYPPSNLNRDDTGRPKTAVMGGVERLRISSQAIKRAVRTSNVFQQAMNGYLGDRTKRLGRDIRSKLIARGLEETQAHAVAKVLGAVFGNLDTEKGKDLFLKQLAFVSKDEEGKLETILKRVCSDSVFRDELIEASDEAALKEADESESGGNKGKARKQSKKTTKLISDLRSEILQISDSSVDIAMFGRMLAKTPGFNREAAVQVAHAVTTHKVTVEDDYFTAVDDLKRQYDFEDDSGAGHVGETGFGSGVFYLYACIDKALLAKNLGGDSALAAQGLAALTEALATVPPTGKQASFASRARADFLLAEKGGQQPRTLAGAFVKPVNGSDILVDSIARLKATRDAMDQAYGSCSDAHVIMDVAAGTGTLPEVKAFVAEA